MTAKDERISWIWARTRSTVKWALVFGFVIFGIPAIKQTLFPDQMTRLEIMLRHAALEDCMIQVERKFLDLILLSVSSNKAETITTEIYEYVLKELPQENGIRVFLSHSTNHNPDRSFYFTQTKIRADERLKQVFSLEVEYCGLLQGDGRVKYEDHKPIYQCVFPVQRHVCEARK